MLRLTDYRVLTLDCYGTLIDWEIGIWDALQPLIMHNGRSDVTRETALRAFAQFENRHEHAPPGQRSRTLPMRCVFSSGTTSSSAPRMSLAAI